MCNHCCRQRAPRSPGSEPGHEANRASFADLWGLDSAGADLDDTPSRVEEIAPLMRILLLVSSYRIPKAGQVGDHGVRRGTRSQLSGRPFVEVTRLNICQIRVQRHHAVAVQATGSLQNGIYVREGWCARPRARRYPTHVGDDVLASPPEYLVLRDRTETEPEIRQPHITWGDHPCWPRFTPWDRIRTVLSSTAQSFKRLLRSLYRCLADAPAVRSQQALT